LRHFQAKAVIRHGRLSVTGRAFTAAIAQIEVRVDGMVYLGLASTGRMKGKRVNDLIQMKLWHEHSNFTGANSRCGGPVFRKMVRGISGISHVTRLGCPVASGASWGKLDIADVQSGDHVAGQKACNADLQKTGHTRSKWPQTPVSHPHPSGPTRMILRCHS